MTSAHAETPASRPSSRCWTLDTATGEIDVEVVARDGDRLSSVLPALAAALGAAEIEPWHGSAPLDHDLPLAAPQLAHGSVLGIDRPGRSSIAVAAPSALELQVVGGPEAGRRFPLGHGEHVVGRGGSAGVDLDDPDISRQHLVIRVGSGAVTAADPGSTNGTRLDGRPLATEACDWPLGSVVRLGSSGLALSGPTGYPAQTEPTVGGRMTLRPTVRMAPPRPTVEVQFPRLPAQPARRRLAWAAVALPAVGGVAMAVLLHTPHFLFFALLSPAMALSTWASDRWSGRRTRRQETAQHQADIRVAEDRLTAAVHADVRAADDAHPNLAVLTATACRRSHLLWGRRAHDTDALTVRLGSAPGNTAVTRIEPDGSRTPVTDPHLPVALDLRGSGGLAVVGPRRLGLEVLAGVIAQLAVLLAPGEVDLLLLVAPENLPQWRWARWLPHLSPDAVRVGSAGEAGPASDPYVALERLVRTRRLTRPERTGPGSWLVVLVDRPLDPRTARLLREAADVGVITLTLAGARHALPVATEALLSFTGETGDRATLSRTAAADVRDVVVDRLPGPVAAALARDLAPLQPGASESDLPRRLRLLELPHTGLCWDGSEVDGAWPRDRSRLAATVGRSTTGPLAIDLCRLGPHALVAGTTGAGKSEFLQSLIAGLALAHPPDRCSFLLVDYKGGAAFGEAAALPHTVGVLTDLDGRTTERALRSLTAELLRREALLARHQVADVGSLPDDVDLARLVIVVDEFATLAEELPAFVPGLVGIAQRGRSLGVHLILATQRPAGVVSPEIRANCTLRICLRTTDEGDSRDVLGLPDAAHLPLDRPGRAYLRAGAEPPILFQVARVAQTDVDSALDGPVVRPWVWPFAAAMPTEAAQNPADSDLGRLCTAIRRHASRSATRPPHRPWRPPLPDQLRREELDGPDSAAGGAVTPPGNLRIGVIDRPDLQAWEVLELNLAVGGGWLAVGSGRSGRTSLLRTVLSEAAHHLGPGQVEVHVLDHGGAGLAADASELPHTGTTVAADDPLRTVRLLARLTEEVAARRAGLRSQPAPWLLLLVDGAEALMEQLDEFDLPGGSASFLRLIRDGAAAGLTSVITADRAIPGARLASAVRQRLILPLADAADYVVAGVPASAVPAVRPPGRALLGESALECQLAIPRPLPSATAGQPTSAALRIPALPERPTLDLPPESASATAALRLPVGPGGDDGGVLEVYLGRTGGLLVAGPPGSGRSTAVLGFAEHLQAGGVPVAHLSPRTPASSSGDRLDPANEVALAAWIAGLDGGPGAVVVDDLDLLPDTSALSRLPIPGASRGVVLLVAAGAAELGRQFQGPVAALRRQRTALLLSPAPGDADILGIRLPRTPVPRRPGSGWLVTPGATERVQVAWRRAAAQSSSSAGPISCVAYQASSWPSA